jgi:hypothetical protein
MPKTTILEWVRRGWVHVTRQLPGYRGRKMCRADADEVDRLTRLRDTKRLVGPTTARVTYQTEDSV